MPCPAYANWGPLLNATCTQGRDGVSESLPIARIEGNPRGQHTWLQGTGLCLARYGSTCILTCIGKVSMFALLPLYVLGHTLSMLTCDDANAPKEGKFWAYER